MKGADRDNGDAFMQPIDFASGINDPEMIESEVLQRHVHGVCQRWCIRVFELESEPLAGCKDQQVELGSSVGCPVVCVSGIDGVQHMLECKAFPGGAQLWVTEDVLQGGELEQSVQHSAVANVDLWSLHLPFLEILKPRWKHADHPTHQQDV